MPPGRISAWRQRSDAGQHAAGQRRQQAGAHRRGLPAAGRPDHGEQRRAHEPGDQLGHEPLATEEVLGVGRVERGEPEEGAHRRERARPLRRSAARARRAPAARAGRRRARPRPSAARRARWRRGPALAPTPPTPAPRPIGRQRDGRPRNAAALRSPAPRRAASPPARRAPRSRPPRRVRAARARAGAPVPRRPPVARAPVQHEHQQPARRRAAAPAARSSSSPASSASSRTSSVARSPSARPRDGGERVGRSRVHHDHPPRSAPRGPARPPAASCRSRADRETTTAAAPARTRRPAAPRSSASSAPPRQQRRTAVRARRAIGRPAATSSAGSWREDRLVQRRSSAPGLDADLLDQRRPRPAVRLERLGLAAAAVQREHQLAVQTLAQRLLRHRGLQLGDQIRVPAQRQLGLDRASNAAQRRSSSRAISACANGSYARSASAARATGRAPRRSVSAARSGSVVQRARPDATGPRSDRRRARRARHSTGTRCHGSRADRFDPAPAAAPTPGCAASSAPWAEATRPTAPRPADRSPTSSLARRISRPSSARWRPVPIASAAPPSPTTSSGPSKRKSKTATTVTPADRSGTTQLPRIRHRGYGSRSVKPTSPPPDERYSALARSSRPAPARRPPARTPRRSTSRRGSPRRCCRRRRLGSTPRSSR